MSEQYGFRVARELVKKVDQYIKDTPYSRSAFFGNALYFEIQRLEMLEFYDQSFQDQELDKEERGDALMEVMKERHGGFGIAASDWLYMSKFYPEQLNIDGKSLPKFPVFKGAKK